MTYTPQEFIKDKILISKMIKEQKFSMAHDHLNKIFQLAYKFPHVQNQASGMMFILEQLDKD